MFHELVYQSIAAKDFTADDLKELMIQSRKYNKEKDITGCLVYHNRTFIQVIEGEKEEIDTLFRKIKVDTRHMKVTKSWESEIETRGFAGWSMSIMNINQHGLDKVFSNFLDTGEFSYDVSGILTTSKSILRSMKDNL